MLSILDVLLPIPYFLIITYIIKSRIKKSSSDIYKKYLLNAWYLKAFAAIMSALMYQYYYHGGDTMAYFELVKKLRGFTFYDPEIVLKIIFSEENENYVDFLYDTFRGYYTFFAEEGTRSVILFGYFIGFFTFFSYIPTSFIFSLIALYGCWKIFKLFYELYPHLEKQLAIACLFIPSVIFWGTGLMKDPLCLGFLGVLHSAIYEIFYKRKNIFRNIVLVGISIYLIKTIKVYILLSFAPALAMWLFTRYAHTVENKITKAIVMPLMLIAGSGVGFLILSQMASVAERYSFESMMRTAKDTQNWLVYSSMQQGGSFYTLGDMEYTTIGLIKVFPKAVNVSLFRPYIWEALKPTLFIAAIEAIITLYLTIMLLFKFKLNIFRLFTTIFSNPDILFCVIFSIIFAFAVGFTSFNFGALARYKLPMLPYYFIALSLLYDVANNKSPIKT